MFENVFAVSCSDVRRRECQGVGVLGTLWGVSREEAWLTGDVIVTESAGESCSNAKKKCRLCSATKEAAIYKTCAIAVIDRFLAFSARFSRRQ